MESEFDRESYRAKREYSSNIGNSLPGIEKLSGEEEGRINIAPLGMRGKVLRAVDSLRIRSWCCLSIRRAVRAIRLAPRLSQFRVIYVTVPGTSDKQKINAVHAYGEEKGDGQGEAMKTILSDVTGQPIQYAVSELQRFEEAIDAVGGVSVTLAEFSQSRCNFESRMFVIRRGYMVPTSPQQYENKYVTTEADGGGSWHRTRCYNKDVECGGVFNLPAGTSVLNGEQALCYSLASVT